MSPLHLSRSRLFEALGGAFVRFQFRHRNPQKQPPARSLELSVLTSGRSDVLQCPRYDAGLATCAGGSLGLTALCAAALSAFCFLSFSFSFSRSLSDFFGARIAWRVFPSCLGRNSTMLSDSTSLINRSRICRPSPVRVISRPRKKMVALTLSPSPRKRS